MREGVAGRLARFAAAGVAAVGIALVLMRLVYTTAPGMRLFDAIPDRFWTRYHGLFGGEAQGRVETLQNVDALVILVLCLVPAAALVAAAVALWRRRPS
jgi:hypothetical protein